MKRTVSLCNYITQKNESSLYWVRFTEINKIFLKSQFEEAVPWAHWRLFCFSLCHLVSSRFSPGFALQWCFTERLTWSGAVFLLYCASEWQRGAANDVEGKWLALCNNTGAVCAALSGWLRITPPAEGYFMRVPWFSGALMNCKQQQATASVIQT